MPINENTLEIFTLLQKAVKANYSSLIYISLVNQAHCGQYLN